MLVSKHFLIYGEKFARSSIRKVRKINTLLSKFSRVEQCNESMLKISFVSSIRDCQASMVQCKNSQHHGLYHFVCLTVQTFRCLDDTQRFQHPETEIPFTRTLSISYRCRNDVTCYYGNTELINTEYLRIEHVQ